MDFGVRSPDGSGDAGPGATAVEPLQPITLDLIRVHQCRRCGQRFIVEASDDQRAFDRDGVFCTVQCKAATSPLLPPPPPAVVGGARTLVQVQRTLRDWVSDALGHSDVYDRVHALSVCAR